MNYIVLSPGRCGSIFLGVFLEQYFRIVNPPGHKLFPLTKESNNTLSVDIHPLIHCHVPQLIQPLLSSYKLIIIKRNVVEITGSAVIAELTNKWYFAGANRKKDRTEYIEKYKDQTFTVDTHDFMNRVRYFCEWYVSVQTILDQAIVLKYDQAIDPESIFQCLNLSPVAISNEFLLEPQPFDKWEKLQNSDKLKIAGNKVFSVYQEKYPKIFNEDHFKY